MLFCAVVIVMALGYAYHTTTFHCGPGCTTNPEKIAAGCPACPEQEAAVAVEVVEAPANECANGECNQKTEDFFHDSVYFPATEDV